MTNHSQLKTLLIVSYIFICLFSGEAFSTVRMGSIDPSRNTTLPNWTGTAGNVTSITTFCAKSVNDVSGLAVPYQLKVYNQTGGAGNPYTLTSGGKPDLPVSWQFSDLLNPGYETLTPNVYTAFNKTGSLCPGGATVDNASLLMTITQANLQSAEAGTYTRKFTVEMLGGNGGTENRKVALGITITIVPLILISGLDDITFPPFLGSNISASDSLCVYRNGPGTYSIRTTGSGVASAYTITRAGNNVPYTVTWNDSSTSAAMTTNITLTGRQNAVTTNTACSNATVTLAITAASLSAVPYGTYTGILTFLVAPE